MAPAKRFGKSTTALEVVEGMDLSGKTFFITGGNSGKGNVYSAFRNMDYSYLAITKIFQMFVSSDSRSVTTGEIVSIFQDLLLI